MCITFEKLLEKENRAINLMKFNNRRLFINDNIVPDSWNNKISLNHLTYDLAFNDSNIRILDNHDDNSDDTFSVYSALITTNLSSNK